MSTVLSRDTILEILDELKPELEAEYKVREIGLFGSYVRGEQNRESDIDILVVLEDDADLFDLGALHEFLEERFQCRVDVVPRDAIREELRDGILQEVSAA